MAAVVFTAADSEQRRYLLQAIDRALDGPHVEAVARAANGLARAHIDGEGDDTSAYLYQFWHSGWSRGRELGQEASFIAGRRDGLREALTADDRERAFLRREAGISAGTKKRRRR
jgi:hypothetical protein